MNPTTLHDRYWGHTPVTIAGIATNPLDNYISTVDTIHQMIQIAKEASSNQIVVTATHHAIKNLLNPATNTLLPGKGHRDLVRSIFWWIKNHVHFIQDEMVLHSVLGVPYEHLDKELLISPEVMISMPNPMGDCDDFSMLFAAMAIAAGLQPGYVVVATDGNDPNYFTHVYCKAYLPDENSVIYIDCSEGTYPGWQVSPSRVYRREEWWVR